MISSVVDFEDILNNGFSDASASTTSRKSKSSTKLVCRPLVTRPTHGVYYDRYVTGERLNHIRTDDGASVAKMTTNVLEPASYDDQSWSVDEEWNNGRSALCPRNSMRLCTPPVACINYTNKALQQKSNNKEELRLTSSRESKVAIATNNQSSNIKDGRELLSPWCDSTAGIRKFQRYVIILIIFVSLSSLHPFIFYLLNFSLLKYYL